MASHFRTMLAETCWLLLSAGLVYMPLVLDAPFGVSNDFRVQELFAQSLASAAVRIDLATNLIAHLLVLAPFHLSTAFLGHRVSRVCGASAGVCRLLLLVTGWVFLVSINHLLFPFRTTQ